jgi:hypothetical protein
MIPKGEKPVVGQDHAPGKCDGIDPAKPDQSLRSNDWRNLGPAGVVDARSAAVAATGFDG